MEKSDYYKQLSGDIKQRYDDKVQIIGDLDPFVLKSHEMSYDLKCLPVVALMDLVNYLILTHSFYTGQQMKAFKSLQAFKYYESGFISKLNAKQINDKFVVVGQVKHSQRLREKSLDVWVILLDDGSVSTGHCTCMAGLGEVCSHIAAILFALHDLSASTSDVSCTDRLAMWPVPSLKNVESARVSEMFPSTSSKKHSKQVPSLKGDELTEFLTAIENTGTSPVITRIIEPFCSQISSGEIQNLPDGLDTLYDEQHITKSYDELLSVSHNISFDLSVEDITKIANITEKQHLSSSWFKMRAGRITASKLRAVCHSAISKPSLSLIKGICYPHKVLFYSKQTAYGIRHEKDALEQYIKYSTDQNHENFLLEGVGFVISHRSPQFGASPDALVSCDCCGAGCVEVKCPYLLADSDLTMLGYAAKKWSCLVVNDGVLSLDTNHSYYYQIQLQMFVTNTSYCDFVIWSSKETFVQRILLNADFLQEKLEQAANFHKYVIMPELLARYFVRRAGEGRVSLWCICQTPDDEKPMITCENIDCEIRYFHLECVNLVEVPNIWFCANCTN